MFVDYFAKATDFVRAQKCRRADAEVELNGLAILVQTWRKPGDFAAQIVNVILALVVIGGDDGGATTEPAERFAERDVEINREVARRAVVVLNLCRKLFPRHGVREFGRGRIAGVARPGHVVFFHQIQIYVQRLHLKPFTVSTKAAIFSSFAPGVKPWPRLKMWPARPRMASKIFLVSAATTSGVDSASSTGERFPCNAMCAGIIFRASAMDVCQSMPRTFAPGAIKSFQFPTVPSEKAMTGGAPVSDPARCDCLLEPAGPEAGAPSALTMSRIQRPLVS